MGPGFESQRDHKASTKVGAFFMPKSVERACNAKEMVTQACLMEPD